MKKYFSLLSLAALLLAFAAAFALLGCSGSGDDASDTPSSMPPYVTKSPSGPTGSQMPLVPATGEIPMFRTAKPVSPEPTDGGGQE